MSIGGGKGGSDFDPKGKSPAEVRRFVKVRTGCDPALAHCSPPPLCQSFGTELSRHIGADTDVPAGDVGFSTREGGFLFGQYKAIKNEWVGMITGKGLDWGGSHVRPEATGYGLVYYVEHMIKHAEGEGSKGFAGKTIAISGSGQVAQFAALKCMELGAIVLSLSDSKGALLVKDKSKPYTKEMIQEVYKIKYDRKELSTLGDKSGALEFHKDGARPWQLLDAYDIALPCATQNELDASDAKAAIKKGCKFVAEGSNMGVDAGGIEVFEKDRIAKGKQGCWYGPGKAANAGGVATSALEMAQNSQRLTWKPAEVDQKLKDIMKDCYDICFKTGAEFPSEGDSQKDMPSLVQGANISGFKRVADAMLQHGDYF